MALVVFLRGVNVGGHRKFRPSVLARELSQYDVINIGAAGTFVVRKPGSRKHFEAALREKLPFETVIALSDAHDVLELAIDNPFGSATPRPGVTRFVSVLSKKGKVPDGIPLGLPSEKEWLVRLIGSRDRFVFGEYRRHMKTIGYLGKIDALFGATATTRNWNTIQTVMRVLSE